MSYLASSSHNAIRRSLIRALASAGDGLMICCSTCKEFEKNQKPVLCALIRNIPPKYLCIDESACGELSVMFRDWVDPSMTRIEPIGDRVIQGSPSCGLLTLSNSQRTSQPLQFCVNTTTTTTVDDDDDPSSQLTVATRDFVSLGLIAGPFVNDVQ